jgi:uncharacterized membrane protein YhfC
MGPIAWAALASALIVVGLAAALLFARDRLGVAAAIFGWGALCFIAAQAVHLPVLAALTATFRNVSISASAALAINVAVLGLTAGLFEETTRYLFLRWRMVGVQSWDDAVGFGLGHGGIEALIAALTVPVQAVVLLHMGDSDLARIRAVSPDQATALAEQLRSLREMTAWTALLPAWERALAVLLHVALTLVVFEAVRRRKPSLLILAIFWHAAVDGAAVLAMKFGVHAVSAELGLTAASLLSVLAIVLTRRAQVSSAA